MATPTKKSTKKKSTKKSAKKSIKKTLKEKAMADAKGWVDNPDSITKRGRPTDYREGLADVWLKYVIDGIGLEKAAHLMGFHYTTILDWKDKHQDFSEAFAYAKEIAYYRIMEAGDEARVPPGWSKLRLQTEFDWMSPKEKRDIELKERELALKEKMVDEGVTELPKLEFTIKTERDSE